MSTHTVFHDLERPSCIVLPAAPRADAPTLRFADAPLENASEGVEEGF